MADRRTRGARISVVEVGRSFRSVRLLLSTVPTSQDRRKRLARGARSPRFGPQQVPWVGAFIQGLRRKSTTA